MRIIVDMQGAQGENRFRGIGRCAISLVLSMVRQSKNHDIILALNGHFADSIEAIRELFSDILPESSIVVWMPNTPTAYINPENRDRRSSSAHLYEAFLYSLQPDMIYIPSLFEGLVDDVITSIHQFQTDIPVAVTLHDLIPLLNPKPYLDNPVVKDWYMEQIENLKRADLWFPVSDSSRNEGCNELKLPENASLTIHNDADPVFMPLNVSNKKKEFIVDNYGLKKPFVMYTGGIDYRKNIEGLIRAYAKIPESIRQDYQLAIVCSIQPDTRVSLEKLARQQGLKPDEMILTGFVSDDDLLALYNLCKLFVFPSWHEGFGLPALEAMRCGAPVIGANASSLPEVIGWDEALFDPYSDDDMAKAMIRGLIDEEYRMELLQRESKHAKQFSWDESAHRAIHAMEQWYAEKIKYTGTVINTDKKLPRLAYVSPLPPARSGIADYSAELLPELSRFYNIELILEQEESVDNAWINANLPIRTSEWLLKNKKSYDRVIYHFGNSSFHQHMFDLLNKVPGVIVQHDFFLSGIQAHRDLQGSARGAWADALYQSHGYQAVYERFIAKDIAEVIWHYPANLNVLQRAKGVIVHSMHSCELAEYWYGSEAAKDWKTIPLLRKPAEKVSCANAKQSLGFSSDDLVVCAFGVLGKSKLNHRLLQAWLNSPLCSNEKAHLVYVGQSDDDDYTHLLLKKIKESTARDRIKITGWADENVFKKYLSAADIGVQLRTLSRGETSAAVLDCMNYGLATIVNAHGSMADLNPNGVWMLPDEFTDDELIAALTTLSEDIECREQLSKQAQEIIRTQHKPTYCAEQYFNAIESFYKKSVFGLDGLINVLVNQNQQTEDMAQLATVLAKNFPPQPRPKQLLVDISELVQRDAKSGIQRVVRAILKQWLQNPPVGFQIQPVYATTNEYGYRYACQFTSEFIGIPDIGLEDLPVDAFPGDVFIGLDLQPVVVPKQRECLHEWRNRGINIWFVVYDLLPVLQRHCFPPEAESLHKQWLSTICEFDGVACISEAVANEFENWITSHEGSNRLRPLKNKWFHLGADMSASVPSIGLASDAYELLDTIRSSISFLMVGTIEPRKGYSQVLDAFEHLWKIGHQFKLVIIGKQGWMVENLIQRLRNHSENGKRLFWLEGISDEYLEKVYAAATCLIAASYGEGFGLPLIEAAQHKIPIIARDIPVFKEVADEYAFYFNAKEPAELAFAIQTWLDLYENNQHPSSVNMPWLSWKQSANQLLNIILVKS